MFLIILLFYFAILLIPILSTVFLIISGKNWGELPHYYVKFLHKIQEKYAPRLFHEPLCGKRLKIIQKRHSGRFLDRIQTAYKAHSFKRGLFVENNNDWQGEDCDYMQIFDLQTDIIQAGVEAVIQVKNFGATDLGGGVNLT
jgi:hypothetical protein